MLSNLRFAFRQLGKSPGFTATVVIVLALGIGATTAIFSVINAVLLHPFPYRDGNRIIFVGSSRLDHPGSQMPVAYPDYLDWRGQVQTVDHLGFATGTSATLTGIPEPAVIRNGAVSAPIWPLLGMQPVLGRVFSEAEDGPAAPPVCVLSYATWQKRFAGDPGILNRSITLDSKAYTVIGVMPASFKFWAADVWTPVGLQADSDLMRTRLLRHDSWVVTRAKPGRTIADVRAELGVIAHQIALQHPDTNRDVGVTLRYLSDSVSGPFRNPLLLMLCAVAAVLLIACANVANLLLARTTSRRRERALPSVASVAASTNAPFLNGSSIPLVVAGHTYTELRQLRDVQYSLVTPGYFRAQGLSLLRGRVFDDTDRAGAQPVIVLNEAAVKKFLPPGDPLGQQVMLGAPDNLITPGMLPAGFDKFQWATVVGVVRDMRQFGLENDPPAAAYIPVRQSWNYPPMRRFMILLVRTHRAPLDAVPALRGLLRSLDPDLPVERISTMNAVIGDSLQATRFNTVLLGLFAALSLALAAVGIYGVVAWNVTQRAREIGIRAALGATRRDVLRLVVGQAMRVVGLGLLLGLAAALALTRLMQSLLFATSTLDVTTFVGVSALLAAVALLACWLPARRATKVDPITALRAE